MSNITEFAALLDEAACNAKGIDQIDPNSRISLVDAYAIQSASIRRRLERGERRVGVKVGFTGRSKSNQMGLSDVIWGRLTDAMLVEEGGRTLFSKYVHPRAEPQITFFLRKPLAGNVTATEALAAVEAVAPAIEIIDSRYNDFRFSLPGVIADNASSSGFVIGSWCDPRQDFANLGLALQIDGRIVQVGSTAAILGHPLRSLVAAARLSAAAGEPLQAGWVVMAGAATAGECVKPGNYVSVEMERLGSCGFHVGE